MSWGHRSAADDDEDDEATVEPSNGEANGDDEKMRKFKRSNSIGYLSEEEAQKKKEVDAQVASYVSDQLQRMKNNDSMTVGQMEDEIEAQLDGN